MGWPSWVFAHRGYSEKIMFLGGRTSQLSVTLPSLKWFLTRSCMLKVMYHSNPTLRSYKLLGTYHFTGEIIQVPATIDQPKLAGPTFEVTQLVKWCQGCSEFRLAKWFNQNSNQNHHPVQLIPKSEPRSLNECRPKPPTFWNSYTRTLILDTIMKLSGTIGVTQKTMTFDTHVCLILLHTLNPQERWGTHKKWWPFQPRPFADAIGFVRCSNGCFECTCTVPSMKFQKRTVRSREFESCIMGGRWPKNGLATLKPSCCCTIFDR